MGQKCIFLFFFRPASFFFFCTKIKKKQKKKLTFALEEVQKLTIITIIILIITTAAALFPLRPWQLGRNLTWRSRSSKLPFYVICIKLKTGKISWVRRRPSPPPTPPTSRADPPPPTDPFTNEFSTCPKRGRKSYRKMENTFSVKKSVGVDSAAPQNL